MSTNIYVGNLPFSATEASIHDLFSEYGVVESVKLITDRDTGRPRGFGFVEMSEGAEAAIEALDQQDFGSPPRPLTVNPARPREERPRRSENPRR
jgi:RNA recognition motif-containing protein